jgi:hypothetical protein
MEWEGLPLVLLRFPIDRRTFVYNIKEQSWDEWATWNGSRWLDWSGRSYVWAPDFGRHLFSASEGGGIYRFSKDAHRDNTSSIVVSKRTGFINHGNDALKRNDKLLLRIKRGYGDITASNPPKLMIKWRDDASPVWSNTIEVSLGKSGDFNQFIELYPRGVYRSRQWEISCSEPIPLAFFDAEEEYSVLRG